jgi:hypothetical protein
MKRYTKQKGKNKSYLTGKKKKQTNKQREDQKIYIIKI